MFRQEDLTVQVPATFPEQEVTFEQDWVDPPVAEVPPAPVPVEPPELELPPAPDVVPGELELHAPEISARAAVTASARKDDRWATGVRVAIPPFVARGSDLLRKLFSSRAVVSQEPPGRFFSPFLTF
jgi:hypothetical protein